jgi:hypothetical protein
MLLHRRSRVIRMWRIWMIMTLTPAPSSTVPIPSAPCVFIPIAASSITTMKTCWMVIVWSQLSPTNLPPITMYIISICNSTFHFHHPWRHTHYTFLHFYHSEMIVLVVIERDGIIIILIWLGVHTHMGVWWWWLSQATKQVILGRQTFI